MSVTRPGQTDRKEHPEHTPTLIEELEAVPAQAMSWLSEHTARRERLQAIRESGWVSSWGWTPPKTKDVAQATSETPAPSVMEDPKVGYPSSSGSYDSLQQREWVQVEGILEGLGEAQHMKENIPKPQSSETRAGNAPPNQDSDEERRAERERLEMYSLMDSI